jgi:hypothetical protein
MAVAAVDSHGEEVEVPMDVLLEDCSGDADETRLQYVLLAIQQRVPDPERVNVVISGDFVGSVQDRSHDRREQAGYDVERLFGTVGAKTITSEESLEATILIPWEAFNSLPEAVLYRLSAHEALHAALHQRDETLITRACAWGSMSRRPPDSGLSSPVLRSMSTASNERSMIRS